MRMLCGFTDLITALPRMRKYSAGCWTVDASTIDGNETSKKASATRYLIGFRPLCHKMRPPRIDVKVVFAFIQLKLLRESGMRWCGLRYSPNSRESTPAPRSPPSPEIG